MRKLALALMLMLPAVPAIASDGVFEINQACAVQTGCFPGDTAGFPVTIDGSAGRSYRLTGSLVVPDELTDGIVVSAEYISIDLGGFEIRGPVSCSGSPVVCTPSSGTGDGIGVVPSNLAGISVRNGVVRGMGEYGVKLGTQAEVMNVRTRSNRNTGIFVDIGSTVSGSTANQNGVTGIYVTNGSTVSQNTSYQNGGDGIQAGGGCNVQGNTVRNNMAYGLNLGSQSAYRANVVTANLAGTVNGASAVNLGNNACDGTTVCP